MRKGRALPSTTSELITTSSTPRKDGSSNMVWSRMPSMIELRPHAEFQQSRGLAPFQNAPGAPIINRLALGAEADRGRPAARGDDLLEPGEGAPAHEQDVGCIDLEKPLLRGLASTLRRHRSHGPLHGAGAGPRH